MLLLCVVENLEDGWKLSDTITSRPKKESIIITMPAERIELLEAIGFTWSVMNWN